MNPEIGLTQQACRACGAMISPVATFCPNCGARGPQPFRAEVPAGAPSTPAPRVTILKVVLAIAATIGSILLAGGLIIFGLLGVGLAACFTTGFNQPPGHNLESWSTGVVIGVSAFCLLAWGFTMWRIFK